MATGRFHGWRWALRSLALVAVLAWLLLPVPLPGETGSYNPISRLTWCSNALACIHERGHALDQSLGWPSQGAEFGRALELYVIVEMQSKTPGPMAGMILDAFFLPERRPGLNQRAEIYADIYLTANGQVGEIPISLRKFYEVQDGTK